MSVHTKDLYEIAVNVESTRKTAETPASGDWIELLEGVVNEVYDKKENTQRHGVLSHSDSDRLIMKDYNMTLKAIIDRIHFPKFVYAILGAQSTTTDDPESGVNTHEFTRDDTNLLPLITITTDDPTDDELRYAGFGVSKLELSFVKDDFLQYSIEGNGLTRDDPGALTTGYVTANSEFLPWMCTVKVADSVAGLSGASAQELSEFNIVLERPNTPYHGVGGGNQEGSEVIAQRLKVSGSITKLFEDLTFKNLAQADDTYKVIQVQLTDTSRTIGASTDPDITILLYRTSARNWVKEPSDEHTEEKFDILVHRDNTNGDVKVTIINEEAAF